jgi:hypothetical protein
MRRAIETLKTHWLPISYIFVLIAFAPAYILSRAEMIFQATTYLAYISNLTANVVLTYFLWGYCIDKATKKYPKWFGWTMFILGIIVMTLLIRQFGDLKVIGLDK